MNEDGVRTAFNAAVVPYWLSALAVMVCRSRDKPPTVTAVDEVLRDSLSCAMRCATGKDEDGKELEL